MKRYYSISRHISKKGAFLTLRIFRGGSEPRHPIKKTLLGDASFLISFHLLINGLCHIAVDAFHLPFSMGFGCRHYVTASDTLEKVEQTALAVCGDYFLRLPDFDPEKEARRIQQEFAFYRAQCCILVDYLGGLQGSIRQLYNESK